MANVGTGRVIVGVGRSSSAYQALRHAVAEARRRGVSLLAVRVFRSTAYIRGLLGETPAVAALAEVETAVSEVELAFAEALGGVPTDMPVEIIARNGRAARTLVSLALRESDLLVIGGGGARRLSRLRRKAIARFCVRRAACPVVIVPSSSLARSAHPRRLAREVSRAVDVLVQQEHQSDHWA
jgi:nucleotide-binding universal stress UspA family protein